MVKLFYKNTQKLKDVQILQKGFIIDVSQGPEYRWQFDLFKPKRKILSTLEKKNRYHQKKEQSIYNTNK